MWTETYLFEMIVGGSCWWSPANIQQGPFNSGIQQLASNACSKETCTVKKAEIVIMLLLKYSVQHLCFFSWLGYYFKKQNKQTNKQKQTKKKNFAAIFFQPAYHWQLKIDQVKCGAMHAWRTFIYITDVNPVIL